MDVSFEFRKGLLFVRLYGILNKETGKLFSYKLKKFINNYGIKYMVINLNNLLFIDDDGFKILDRSYLDILNNDGKLIICNYQNILYKDIIERRFDDCYKIASELEAFKLISV